MKNSNLLFFRVLLLALLITGVQNKSFAQNETITGVVKSNTGELLSGVTFRVKGSNEYAISKEDGTFSINASKNDTLSVTYIGYETKELIASSSRMNVVLTASDASVAGSDVVVTALGIKRERKSLGYAVSTINGDELTKAGATMNPFLALYGKAAGVGVNVGASGPEGGLKINIRGAASLNPNQNVRPLFVVDGVIINDRSTAIGGSVGAGYDYGSNINDINSEDIASIDILKGAKATVLYGTDAANGVVIITTKSGKGSKGLGITGSFQTSIEHPKSYLQLQNEYGLGDDIYDTIYTTLNGKRVRQIPNKRFSFGPKFDGSDVMFSDSMMYKNSPHDGYNSLFSNGASYNSNVAISSSSDKGSLRASYTNYRYNDIISPNSWQKRNTFSFNGTLNASKFAKFDFVTNLYNIVSQNRRESNSQSIAWGFPADFDFNTMYHNVYLDNTGYKRDLSNYGIPSAVSDLSQYMWDVDKNKSKDDKFHMVTSAKLTLNFTKNLFLVSQFGLDYDNTNYTTEKSVTRIIPTTQNGYFGELKETNSIQTYQSLLNFTQDFSNDNLHLLAYAGAVYRLRNFESIGVGTIGGLRYPDWYSLNNQAGQVTNDNFGQGRSFARGNDVLYSGLASATLSWRTELYLELQARQDWNSTLPPGNNRYFYPGASLTWNYTDRFHIKGMNTGQFRFSWADVGNGTERYYANNLFSLGYLSGNGVDAVTVTPPGSLLPGVLKPERKREFEVGINNSFFQGNRIVIDLSYYTNNRYNQIITLPTSPSSSSNGLLINAANMRTSGFEFQIVGTPVLTKDMRWDITLNGANQNSKVLELGYGLTTYRKENLINGSGAYIAADVNQPYGEIKMNDYTRDDKGNRVVSSSGLYTLNSGSPVTVGNIMPKLYGGLLSDFNYKNFNFRIGLDYKYGGTIFSYTNQRLTGVGQLESTLQYRDEAHGGMAYYIDNNGTYIALSQGQNVPSGVNNTKIYHDGLILPGVMSDGNGGYVKNTIITSATNYYETYANDLASSFPPDGLHKNDYIKVREVALSYNFPYLLTKRLGVQKLSVTIAARNLFYLYKSIPNIDVESALGADGFVENTIYPGQQTYSFGVNVSF